MLDNITSTGNAQADLVSTLTAPATNYSALWAIIILLPLFTIITIRTFLKEKAQAGRGDIWGSLAVGSFVTILVGLLMSLVGLIGSQLYAWIVGLGIVFIVIFLLLKE